MAKTCKRPFLSVADHDLDVCHRARGEYVQGYLVRLTWEGRARLHKLADARGMTIPEYLEEMLAKIMGLDETRRSWTWSAEWEAENRGFTELVLGRKATAQG